MCSEPAAAPRSASISRLAIRSWSARWWRTNRPSMMLLTIRPPSWPPTQDLYDTYRSDGVDAAMGKFFGDNGLAEETRSRSAARVRHAARGDGDVCPGQRQFRVLARPRHDAALALPSRRRRAAQRQAAVVVAIGEQSAGQPIDGMAMALAEKLGTEPVRFPGDHMGFGPHADTFARPCTGRFGGK